MLPEYGSLLSILWESHCRHFKWIRPETKDPIVHCSEQALIDQCIVLPLVGMFWLDVSPAAPCWILSGRSVGWHFRIKAFQEPFPTMLCGRVFFQAVCGSVCTIRVVEIVLATPWIRRITAVEFDPFQILDTLMRPEEESSIVCGFARNGLPVVLELSGL